MKHLILAASFSLIAAPAFAGDVHVTPKAKTFTETQVGGYTRAMTPIAPAPGAT